MQGIGGQVLYMGFKRRYALCQQPGYQQAVQQGNNKSFFDEKAIDNIT